jgi:hypothetical protein
MPSKSIKCACACARDRGLMGGEEPTAEAMVDGAGRPDSAGEPIGLDESEPRSGANEEVMPVRGPVDRREYRR